MSTAKGDTLFQSNEINVGDKIYITRKGEENCVPLGKYKYLDHLTVKTKDLGRGRFAESFCTYEIVSDDGQGWIVLQEDLENGTLATYAMLSPTDKMELWRREGIDIRDDICVTIPFDEECECHIKEWSKAEMNKQKMIEEEMERDCEEKPYNPLDVQHGGGHYKDRAIQPIEYIMSNNLNFCEGNVVKYVTRHRSKNGREDLEKAKHYVEFLIYQWDKEHSN